MSHHSRNLLLVPVFFFLAFSSIYSQEQRQANSRDTAITSFRKGRWFTGLSGSISTSSVRLGGQSDRDFASNYGMHLSSGKFVINRFLVGSLISAERTSSTGSVERVSESLFIGPLFSYFVSRSPIGSVFLSFSPGYSRFRDETNIDQNGSVIQERTTAQGFGAFFNLGYSFVIADRVTFDLGFGLTGLWARANLESQPSGETSRVRINVSNLAFVFGFNVLL